jgi:cytoskeletal protein CcmA (bactofilin family)
MELMNMNFGKWSKRLLITMVIWGTIVGVGHSAYASIFKHDSTVLISQIESIDDDYYIYANKLSVEGLINGDLSAFSFKSQIQGEVTQSANLFAKSVKHFGKVDGSLRAFAQEVTVNGYVGRSAVLFGNEVEVNRKAVIERDLNVYGGVVTMDGTVKGNANIKCARLELTGVIVGNLDITADNINISAPAVVTGNLNYTSIHQANIQLDKGVSITGTTTWNLPKKDEDKEKENAHPLASFILRISGLLASLIFGLVVARVFRPYAEESFNQLRTRFATALAAGLLGILILALCLIVLVVSLASLLAGYLLIANGPAPLGSLIMIFSILMIPVTSFAAVTGTIILYSGKILCGFLLGYLIMSRARQGSPILGKAGLFVGLVILALVFAIPVVGWLFYVAAGVIGGGAILLGIKHCRRSVYGSAQSTLPPAGGAIDPQGQA